MRSKISKLLTLVSALAMFALPALASQKDDDFAAAQAAANANRIEEAARLFCGLAKQDPGFRNGEAAQNCKIYQDQVNRENARNEERFTDGINFFNQGQFDNAANKFRAIHSGPHLAEATDYLNNKIPAAKQAAQGAEAAAAMNGKFDQGVQAFNNNAFANAKSLFGQVTGGAHQGEAQSYLQKIQQYEQLMQQGDSARGTKNYKAALDAYQQAASIKGDGPGDPNGKMSVVRDLMAAAGTVAPPPTQVQQPKPQVVANAVIESNKPKLDVKKLLKEAQAAERRGDVGTARGKYLAVLSEDSGNAQAQAGLNALPKDNNQKAGAEADTMLAKAIGEFYSGQYDDAESHIGAYLFVNGSKTGLAYFYRGVSKLTRYYLHGEQPSERTLLSGAKDDFVKAKKASGFKAPENMVSPKIMKVFDQAS
jgi:hypothetical protein